MKVDYYKYHALGNDYIVIDPNKTRFNLTECRSAHSSRDINFVFIEITMYPGRSAEMKKKLMERVNLLVHGYLGVDLKDINCSIVEVPAENWGGGVSHKYIKELSE